MKSLVFGLPVVFAAGQALAEPTGRDQVDPQPIIAVERPRMEHVFVEVSPDRVLQAANTNKIFLNRCVGNCTVSPGATDSRTNRSELTGQQRSLSAFSRGDTVWNNVVSCVKDIFSPFGVEIVTTDPGPSVNHFEIMIAGTPQQMGFGANTGGVSPYNYNIEYIPNSLVFVFDIFGPDVENLCATAGQEIAHSFGLDHTTDSSDPLTYFSFTGRKRFKDAQVQCGSDCFDNDNNAATANVSPQTPTRYTCTGTTLMNGAQNHPCQCHTAAHPDCMTNTQNSAAQIRRLFGAGTPTPPVVAITVPKTGDNVKAGFAVAADVMDDNGIGSVELRVDGTLTATITQFPYVFNAPATLGDGTHTAEVTAYDNFGASAKKSVQVIIGKPCAKAADCPNPTTDACVGGRCVPGPTVDGGLGTVCTENGMCLSGQCGMSSDGMYCVEECDPSKDECPGGFTCLATGTSGVCWPGDDGGGCCETGNAGAGWTGMGLFLVALLWFRRRR